MKKKTIENLIQEYNLPESELVRLYVVEKKSLPQIKKIKGSAPKTTVRLLNHFDIVRRSISQARLTNEFKELLKTSLETKYGSGITNVSQVDSIKRKKEESCIKKYGVTNIRKSKEYYRWLDNFMLEKYGSIRTGFVCWNKEQHSEKTKNQWKKLTLEEREEKIKRMIGNLSKGASRKNNLEMCMCSTLEALRLSYSRFYPIGRRVYDFYIPALNLIVETNGDFWHANPIKYKESDILQFPGSRGVVAKDLWENDKKKVDAAIKNGFNVLTVWESDKKKFLEILSNEIKKYQENTIQFKTV
jgi:G:T-mismatch repair DNA endonuclease (very short patch repair protein)